MKTHTTIGCDILQKFYGNESGEFDRYSYEICRHHHERWDGSGYPDGLKGDEISLWAQVVSLADVYDALICKRVYKEALPRQTVLDMIRTGQCGAFSPRLLECFFSVEEQLAAFYHTEGIHVE